MPRRHDRFGLRLAMMIVVAAGLLVLIIPVCHAGMSATPIAGSSTAAIAHRPASGAGCATTVRAGIEPCGVGTQISRLSGAQISAGVSSAVGSSGPLSGASMLACVTVLMVVLAAMRWLRRPSPRHTAAAPHSAPMLIPRVPRPPTLAELCVLRT